MSDLTVEQDGLLPEILTQPAAWAGCVAGALAEDDFLHKLQLARFTAHRCCIGSRSASTTAHFTRGSQTT